MKEDKFVMLVFMLMGGLSLWLIFNSARYFFGFENAVGISMAVIMSALSIINLRIMNK